MRESLEELFDRIFEVDNRNPDDYIDPETGLLCCGQCLTPKQCQVELFGEVRIMPCICRCEQERDKAEIKASKEQERLIRIRKLKANGLQDRALHAYTFDCDDGTNPAMKYARNYVENWTELVERGQGLLLWGGVGTGKTFAAACIANALADRGIPVLMTNFSKILNSLSGMFSEDKNSYLSSLNEYKLLVIDDLGVERKSEYAQEQVYNIIDSRYLSRLPFIITTNLSLQEIQNAGNLAQVRIYDRILERCVPICFSGRNYRKENANINREDVRKILSE